MDTTAQALKITGGQLQEEVLEWFNYPHVSTHHGYSLLSQLSGGESCITFFRKALEQLVLLIIEVLKEEGRVHITYNVYPNIESL